MRRSERKAKETIVSTHSSRSQGTTVLSTVEPPNLPGSHSATVHSTSAEGFNTRELRNALGSFATGVTIITTRDREGKLHGMTANSFTSVSLSPPLVLWSSSLYAQSLPAFQEATHFVVNILAFDQIELSNHFAKQSDDKFINVAHIIPESGAPVLIGAAAHFECRNEFRHYGGDHIIFIGHVERFAYTDRPTLLFCRGKYMRGEPILQT
jgi:flavin reductase (DIM6/NTAB) family NADH-FMN oxidoreductase RutF